MKRMMISAAAILLTMMMTLSAAAKTIIIDGDWSYEATADASAWMIDNYIGKDTEVVIAPSFASKPIVTASDHAFMNHTELERIDMGEVLAVIGDYCFTGCSALSKVKLSSVIASIGIGAFSNNISLSAINLEDTAIESVSAYCFAGSGLAELELPETCTMIANNAFLQCGELKKIVIPASVTEIADTAFSGCEKLVIYAPYGSYAIDYAIAHGIDYIYSDLEAYTFKIGDADGDGDITIMDATRVQRVLAKFDDDADGMISLRAAMDDDKVLGIMDATRIQRMLANFDDPYHIGESMTVYLSPDGKVIDAAVDSAKSE